MNVMQHFGPHMPVLPALFSAEAPPADSLLHSLYERKEEAEEDAEEKSQKVYLLERSFEVSVQHMEQKEGQKVEGQMDGQTVAEFHFLLYSLKTEKGKIAK